ncbi:hypothetical protein [Acetobacter musti]|uniref:hypothetical protein n=1 Tax=Acetobacter musti TaxID=864732 RepID=UPI001F55343D|nr:hypothetical protein [Acetobacter musti]
MNRQNIKMLQQISEQYTSQDRLSVPAVHQPPCLPDDFWRMLRTHDSEQQQNSKRLRFCVRPDNIGVQDTSPVTPCPNEIKPQQNPKAISQSFFNQVFGLIFRPDNRYSFGRSMVISMRQMLLIHTRNNAFSPALPPDGPTKAVIQLYKNFHQYPPENISFSSALKRPAIRKDTQGRTDRFIQQ